MLDIAHIPSIVEFLGKTCTMPSFVKVGANDGLTGDPCGDLFLREKHWKGLLIEPVDYCVKKLRKIYSDKSRFTIEQAEVGRKAERRKFYFMAKEAREHIPELPEICDQLGSFNRQHIVLHFTFDVERYIIETEINVYPLSMALKRLGFRSPMFLHIDVEGFDYEVLKSLNMRKTRPEMILAEHKHLSASDLMSMIKMLRSNGYLIWNTGEDLVAFTKLAAKILDEKSRLPV